MTLSQSKKSPPERWAFWYTHPMKLLLTSSGNTNKSIENALLELLGKPFTETNLVFVPTAANPERGDKSWLETDIQNFRKLGFHAFDVIDISSEKKEEWLPIFEKADILIFGGGNEEHLIEWIRKTGLDQLLPEFLKTKIYVGISAGSMITAKILSLNDSGRLYYENFNQEDQIEGLGYVDFEIRPHLNSGYFQQVRIDVLEEIASKVDHPFYAIDDDTAIQIIDGEVSVISEGNWKKFN